MMMGRAPAPENESPTAKEDEPIPISTSEPEHSLVIGNGVPKNEADSDKQQHDDVHADNDKPSKDNTSPECINNPASIKPDNETEAPAAAAPTTNSPSPVAALCKRVRFSVCEYITETLVHDPSHINPAFLHDSSDNSNSSMDSSNGAGSKRRYIGGKLRRDSVHPLVPYDPKSLGIPSDDQWDVANLEDLPSDSKDDIPWSDMTSKQKLIRVLINTSKFLGLLLLLYLFVCSLDLLSLGFRLVGGRTAGEIFRNSSILQNPVVGLMLGILTTVLVQSSSTSSSILVGMVSAGFMDVRLAIPPIMGANIGTSITNTIVSFTQAADRNQFRRAFAGATVLDMFNWITVLILLPIEVIFGYLYHVSLWTVDLIIPDSSSDSGGEVEVLTVITKPFVDLIVQLNDTVMDCWASPNCTDADDASLIRTYCSVATTSIQVLERVIDLSGNEVVNIQETVGQQDLQRCDFLFAGTSMSDVAVGAIILIASLIVLCTCLVLIVKLLNTLMQGHVSKIIRRVLNANIPYVPWITGYIAILIGAVMTFLVQSSSVFTSALTPLVGMGMISLERVYPLTLGANIGTTTTAILASMAAEGKALHPSLQIALCHFYFNLTGVILFYPVPFLRFPIGMAKVLGNITAKYRWFAIFYLVAMFGLLPVVFISLSLAGSIYVVILVCIVGAVVVIVGVITVLQRKVPGVLPGWMRTWKWLPEPMRSLKPYDKVVGRLPCCKGGGGGDEEEEDDDEEEGGFGGGKRDRMDGDFVYLTGNKIPPPGGFGSEGKGGGGVAPPIITRIVPTRVIRNISGGEGGGGRSNGVHGSVSSGGSGGNGELSRNTLPMPGETEAYQKREESRSAPEESNGLPPPPPQQNGGSGGGVNGGNGSLPYQNNNSNNVNANGSSLESFLV